MNDTASTAATIEHGISQGPMGAENSTPQVSPQPQISWLPDVDELTTGYVQNKGWQRPNDLLESYRNLEQYVGADRAGRGVVIPKEDAPPEDWQKFYGRVGRPDNAEGYKLDIPADIGDPEFAKAAAEQFHKANLTKSQAKEMTAWWNERQQQALEAYKTEKALRLQEDEAAIEAEWGMAFIQNLNKAQMAKRALGLQDDQTKAISDAIGHKNLVNLLLNVGNRISEDSFVHDDNVSNSGQALTPAQAKDKILQLRKDPDFIKKYQSGDQKSLDEMMRLQRFAAPEPQR